ncbi:SLOG family protein [Paludicola sp. MB14-C6]|uniref:SLOG family protein n=1 Tax=Paludihabitans sp. MB14-C6 TaxID=3070656 RepID=UPI0027DE7738|nr:SLOG family protein [Paludicola sp. MB14-C6]WMJ22786.1 SLOG family protein [Paludicola sp. MB14-C6]
MKVAVIGSRDCKKLTTEAILEHIPADCTHIISGGAIGVDRLAKKAAELLSIPIIEFLPDYQTFGKTAPLVRNRKIISEADFVLAFWDYQSSGTRHALVEALKQEKKVKIIMIQDE